MPEIKKKETHAVEEELIETPAVEEKKPEAPATKEKMVEITIPREGDEDGDVFVSINDRTWQIKRCERVMVPECVAAVLKNREDELDRLYRAGRK